MPGLFVSGRKDLRVAVYAGPTGGHLFPAQAFTESFRKVYPQSHVELVTSGRAGKLAGGFPAGLFDKIRYLPDFGLPQKVVSMAMLKPLFLMPYLFFKSWRHLSKLKPALCVGFGSFVSYPGVRTAKWMGIPVLIHEQNRYAGKATRWLVPHADQIAESFPGTGFPEGCRNVRTVGLPLRESVLTGSGAARMRSEKLRILVMGGSQGAHGLNRAVIRALEALNPEEKSKIAVTHITGSKDQAEVGECYCRMGLTFNVLSFSRDMPTLFMNTDLAVTRAGANTLFELAFYGIPAFVIPFPHAGGHQKLNARSFAERGGLDYHDEDKEAPEWLTRKLRGAINGSLNLDRMALAIKELARPDAGNELVRIARELITEHEDRKRRPC